MIEYISNEDEQKRVREEIRRRWESLGLTTDLKGAIKENLRELFESECRILPKELNDAVAEHGLDLVEVQPMEPPKKL